MSCLYLLQLTEAVEGVQKVTEDKSETFTLIFIGMALIGFVIWRWEARANKEDERQIAREEHQRKKDEKDSEALAIVGTSSQATAQATQVMATAVQTIEKRQRSDRRALIHVIDAIREEDESETRLYLERAKNHLLDD